MKRAHCLMLAVATIAATSLNPVLSEAETAAAGPVAAATRTVENGVAYITGGVGSDEADALRSVASQYSLHLTFVTSGGQFLSDVNVEIVGPSGASVLRTRTLGPYLYVSLPPGKYQVAAYTASARETRVVLVGAHQGANVEFAFPPLARNGEPPLLTQPAAPQ